MSVEINSAHRHKRHRFLPTTRKIRYILSVLIVDLCRKRSLGSFGPRLIEITLTNRSQCHHVYEEAPAIINQDSELSSGEIALILKDASLLGFTEVNFRGGEPLLRGDILELIRIARTAHMLPKLYTNGILLTDKLVKSLKQAGLSWCAVSIDSADYREHDRLRGYDGCFHLATRGIRSLVFHGIPTSIITHVRRETLANGDLNAIINMGYSLGVETVHLLNPNPISGLENAENKVLNREERKRVRKLLSDPLVTMESSKKSACSTAEVTTVNIMPNGNVSSCDVFPWYYGNAREERLSLIWKRMRGSSGCKSLRTVTHAR